MLFRDAGAATVTVLHRTSYRELFEDAASTEVGRGQQWAGVGLLPLEACWQHSKQHLRWQSALRLPQCQP